MIVIHSPEIIVEGDEVILSSELLIEGEEQRLWYRFPAEFGQFLVTERLDAIVVGLLPLALKLGLDIKVKGAISSRLFYTINHYLIPTLCLANPEFRKVRIHADRRESNNLNVGNVAGTGLSCGVDSFATYYDHIDEVAPYKIEYFTFFNVGSHGDFGGGKAREVFFKRLESVKEFADKVDVKLITVDSNLSELLSMNFQQTITLRNVSCVLNLQKLFKSYYLASKNRFDYFKLHPVDSQDYDSLILNMFSTESTTFYSAASHLSRAERTIFISKFEDTYKFLDVCTNPNGSSFKNCGACEKCLRTALSLELYEKLELYKHVFDLEAFKENKDEYIGKVIANRELNQINEEIFLLLKEKRQIRPLHYWYSFLDEVAQRKKTLKKSFKNKAK